MPRIITQCVLVIAFSGILSFAEELNTESDSSETTVFSLSTEFFTDGINNSSNIDRFSPDDVQPLGNAYKDDSSSNSSLQFLSHNESFNSVSTTGGISEEDAGSENTPHRFKPINDEINSEATTTTEAETNDSENYKLSKPEPESLHTETTRRSKESSSFKSKNNPDAIQSGEINSTSSSVYVIESKQQANLIPKDAGGADMENTEKAVIQSEEGDDKNKTSEYSKSSHFGTSSASSEIPTEASNDETTVTVDLDLEAEENLEIRRSTRKRSLNTTISSKSEEINPTTAFSTSTEISEFQTSISTSISQHSEQNILSKLEVSASIKKDIPNIIVKDTDAEIREDTILARTESPNDLETTTDDILSNTQNSKHENSGSFASVENDDSVKSLVTQIDDNIKQNSDMISSIKLQSSSVRENIDLSSTENIIANEKVAINSESPHNIHSDVYQSSHPILDAFTEYPLVGNTFDPDGVTNQDSPDPDSVTFSVENSETKERELDRPADASNSSTEIEGQRNGLTKYEWDLIKRLEEDIMYGDTPVLNESSSKVVKLNDSASDKVQVLSHQLLPHDDPDVTVAISKESLKVEDSSKVHNLEELTTIASSTHFEKSDDSGILHNGASNFDFEEVFLQNSVTRPSKYSSTHSSANKNLEVSVSNGIAEVYHPTNFKTHNPTVPSNVEAFSLSYEPQTAQSEVRPVMLKIPSPPSSPVYASSQGSEPSTAQNQWKSSQAIMSFEAETTTPVISSPILLPNPAPSNADEKLDRSTELPTTVIQPELVESFIPRNSSVVNVVNSSNSTIAGIAVKTSVSVSIPLLENSSHNALLKPDDLPHEKADDASMSETAFGLPKLNTTVLDVNLTVQSPSSTSTPTSTPESESTRIRKPKIKIPGIGNGASRERRPFTPKPPPKPATTEGPPVSIFSKARTRRPSITSSTTAASFPRLATIRINYASFPPDLIPLHPDVAFSMEPITTTVPTTTETEEPFSDEPLSDQTQTPSVSVEDDVTLVKVAGYIVLEKGLRWYEQLDNRHSPLYKERANFVHRQLERLFRSSPIAPRLWKIRIDGFSGLKDSRAVAVDFFVYLIKTKEDIKPEHLTEMFHDKLKNNTFSRFRVDTSRTAFELLQEEHLNKPTPSPEEEPEALIPQWVIAVIVIGAASLIFIILFAAVTVYGRHHMRRRYSSKLSEEDIDRSGDWESKMASAYENLAADTIYDAEDLHRGDSYKKHRQVATFHGKPLRPKRCDSWSSSDWSTAPRRQRPHVHRIVY